MFRVEQIQEASSSFTQDELRRLAIYRAAVRAGFFNEGFQDGIDHGEHDESVEDDEHDEERDDLSGRESGEPADRERERVVDRNQAREHLDGEAYNSESVT